MLFIQSILSSLSLFVMAAAAADADGGCLLLLLLLLPFLALGYWLDGYDILIRDSRSLIFAIEMEKNEVISI